jgi:hypothetical protein
MRRRRLILLALAALVLVAAALGGGFWSVLGEERRSGRLVSRVLSDRTGMTIQVERASFRSRELVFRGVHVRPGAHWKGDVRIRELRVLGGILPILFPRGRPLAVVAVSTSVTLAETSEPITPPTPDALEAVRRGVAQVIAWPAPLSLRIVGGELRSGDDVFAFDLEAQKTETGALGVTLNVSPPEGGPALTLRLAGRSTPDRVEFRVGVGSEPSRLGAFWPATLPALTRLALETDGALHAGGRLELAGRARAERRAEEPPLAAEFAAVYHAAGAKLELSRLATSWGPDVSLQGSGRVDLQGPARVALDLTGTVEGTAVKATLAYASQDGTVSADLDLDKVDTRRLFARAGLGMPPADFTARRLRSTLSATLLATQIRVQAEATLHDMELRAWLPDTRVEGGLTVNAVLDRGAAGLTLATLDPSTVTLTRNGAPFVVAGARSRNDAPWPLAVEATIDLQRLPPVPAMPAALEGRATISGDLHQPGVGGPRFAGTLTADMPRAEIQISRPVVVTKARLAVPISHGIPSPSTPGTMTAERIEAFGFALHGLESAARFADGNLKLSDIRYRHYGGGGSGAIEAATDGRAVPIRARIEGEHIDLAALAKEYGLTVAQLSGKVRYLVVLQYSTARGFNGAGQVSSEEGGGEIGIEAIEKLLSSAVVQAEGTGLLRQVLENLRVFKYASLEGDVRVSRDGGHINLSIEGKKRLGIFPPPIKAINFNNVPIALLARLFARKEAS